MGEPMVLGTPESPQEVQYLPPFFMGEATPITKKCLPSKPLLFDTPKFPESPDVIASTPKSSYFDKNFKFGPPIIDLYDDMYTRHVPYSLTNTEIRSSPKDDSDKVEESPETPPETSLKPAEFYERKLRNTYNGFLSCPKPPSIIKNLPNIPVISETDYWVTVFGFPQNITKNIIDFMKEFGLITDLHKSCNENFLHVRYSSIYEVKNALSSNGCLFTPIIMLGVVQCKTTQFSGCNTLTNIALNIPETLEDRHQFGMKFPKSFQSHNSQCSCNETIISKMLGYLFEFFGWVNPSTPRCFNGVYWYYEIRVPVPESLTHRAMTYVYLKLSHGKDTLTYKVFKITNSIKDYICSSICKLGCYIWNNYWRYHHY